VIAILEGDFPEELTDARALAQFTFQHYGAAGSLILLYLEETGVPLPVPGDVYVGYLGRLAGGDVVRWLAAWLGIVAVVVAGSSNLYFISRRWGTRLLEHRVAALLHIEPQRLAAAESRFARRGAIAIIFGRHVPGLRVPITVAAGVSRVPYPLFAGSVAISSAGWAAIWLWLGGRFGPAIGRFFSTHAWTYALAVVVMISVVATVAVMEWRRTPKGPTVLDDVARP
jgi:membrane protein DedA with SNARE-associated domain